MNTIEPTSKEIIVSLSEIGAKILEQQKSIDALHEKEIVYAKSAVVMSNLNAAYSKLKTDYDILQKENSELRIGKRQNNELFEEYQKNAIENLNALSGQASSILENYFNLPVFEKNKPGAINKTKAELLQLIIKISDNIKGNKSYEE